MTVPYLRSEYGKEYDFDAPVKLLDAMMHEQALAKGQAVVVLGQVLAADINIGYEDLVNIRVRLPPQPHPCHSVTLNVLQDQPSCAVYSALLS